MLTPAIKESIDKSVLCWLATASKDHTPNVSPKEAFTYYEEDKVIIANIASPQTIRNIQENNLVCVSFIDIFVQKGFQLKGSARIVKKQEPFFEPMEKLLLKIVGEKFPFKTITQITIEQVKEIIAPSYRLYPEITEAQQIESAKKTYRIL